MTWNNWFADPFWLSTPAPVPGRAVPRFHVARADATGLNLNYQITIARLWTQNFFEFKSSRAVFDHRSHNVLSYFLTGGIGTQCFTNTVIVKRSNTKDQNI